MNYESITKLLANYIMNEYDIKPSLARETVNYMFLKAAEYISLEEEQINKKEESNE